MQALYVFRAMQSNESAKSQGGIMGYIRYLLALIVVMGHTGASQFFQNIGGGAAVQAFFMISGFYMAASYQKNYTGKWFAFLVSRFLRLYPFYITIIAVMWVIYLLSGVLSLDLSKAMSFTLFFGPPASPWIKAAVFSMLGLDFAVASEPLSVIPLLPIRPAWAVSAEMAFYMLTPLILYRSRHLVPVIIGLVVLRYVTVTIFHEADQAYYLFYNNLFLYLFGIYLFKARHQLTVGHMVGKMYAAIFVVVCFGGFDGNFDNPLKLGSFLTLGLLALITPSLFENVNTRPSKLLGDLSYGLYIIHVPLLDLLVSAGLQAKIATMGFRPETSSAVFTLAVVLIGTAIAWLFEIGIQDWIDRKRREAFYRR